MTITAGHAYFCGVEDCYGQLEFAALSDCWICEECEAKYFRSGWELEHHPEDEDA